MPIRATIARRGFTLDRAAIERRMRSELSEPLSEHYVVVGGRRYPPKQVLSLVTGLDRADFTTHQARSVLSRLGFAVGRRSRDVPRSPSKSSRGPHGGREAELLRPHAGKWVAQRGLEVLVAGDSPDEVLSWLERHRVQAEAMFRVPRDEAEASGFGPG